MLEYGEDNAGRLTGAGGLALHWRGWLPPRARPAGVVILVHGLGDHSGRWRETARRLSSAGLAAYALDHRGSGLSGGRRGHVDQFADLTADLIAFIAFTRGRHPSRPLFLLGHSLGGLVVLDLALGRPDAVDGVAVSSPCLAIRLPIPVWKRSLARLAGRWLPGLTLPSGIPAGYRSRDPEAVRARRHDPLVHDRVSAALFREWNAAMDRVRPAAGELNVPALFLQAGADRLVEPGVVKEFYDQVPGADKSFVLYTGWYHDVFAEPEREQAWRDLLRWLQPRLA